MPSIGSVSLSARVPSGLFGSEIVSLSQFVQRFCVLRILPSPDSRVRDFLLAGPFEFVFLAPTRVMK